MIKIMLISCGTNACYHISKILKEKFGEKFYIIGTDINDKKLIPNYYFIDKFYKVPMSSDANYYETVLNILKEEKPDFLIPTFDFDQQLFYPENPDLKALNIKSLSAGIETLKIYKDKITMNDFLIKNKFKVPKTYDSNTIEDEKAYFVKPMDGFGSIGAMTMSGKEIKHRSNAKFLLIQEICKEPEITLECFYYKNTLRSIARERIAAKSGVCTKARVYTDKNLEKIALKLTQTLDCPIYFNMQFMHNTKGEPVITDVNLRLAGGMSMSNAAGWDEVSAIGKIMLGKTVEDIFATLPKHINQQYVVRAYTDIVIEQNKPTVVFDLDGTLLDSRKRHSIVLNDILKKFNIKIDTSDLIEFKREGYNNKDYLIHKGVDEKLAREIQKEWILNIEREDYLAHDILYKNTVDILTKYSKNNDLILLTARNNKNGVLKQIKELKIENFFKHVEVVPSNEETAKQKALYLAGCNPCLFIGDTKSDATAAKIAQVNFKHANEGFHNYETAVK